MTQASRERESASWDVLVTPRRSAGGARPVRAAGLRLLIGAIALVLGLLLARHLPPRSLQPLQEALQPRATSPTSAEGLGS